MPENMTIAINNLDQDRSPLQRRMGIIFTFQIIALIIAAWHFRHALNPDAVAYLQIARHYADGELGLAISGHWSPLISWVIALFIKLGLPPIIAARLFMILSAVIFLLGCLRLFRESKISDPLLRCGMWTTAMLSVPWSVENITPDLLLGALVSFAFAEMAVARWFLMPWRALLCGVLWGLAYLCKSVALPLGAVTALGMILLWWKREHVNPAQIIRTLGLTISGMALIACIWIAVLTIHYGKLTIANSASYNHSLVGPDASKHLFLLDQGLRIPQAGRVTIWEDPGLPYPDWSPLASKSNAMLQLQILAHNVPVVFFMLTSISLVFPVLLVTRLACVFRPDDTGEKPIVAGALLPVFVLGALFLPNYLLATEQRYFYCLMPLLLVAAASHRWSDKPRWQRIIALVLAASFLIPTLGRTVLYLNSSRIAGECAASLAEKIAEKKLTGPVVGSGRLAGGRTGMYVAYLLHEPWFGDEPSPTAADYKSIGARLMVVNRGTFIASELAADPAVRNLDLELFGLAATAETFPIQVFENIFLARTE